MNIPIGTRNSSYGEQELIIDSFSRTFVDGVSGVGKSTRLEDAAIRNVRAGQGILFIGPHGASIRRILALPPLEPRGDESCWKGVLKASRMRWGKKRKDAAGIVKLLNQPNWRTATFSALWEIGIGDLYGARER